MASGYIKTFRQIEEWEWYQDANTFRVFMHCLIRANYEEKKWKGEVIPVGSFITSSLKLAEELKLSRQQIRHAISNLQSTNEITIKSTNKYIVINVQNWRKYQSNENENNQQDDQQEIENATIKQPTNNQQTTTTKERKNKRNKEEKNGEDKKSVTPKPEKVEKIVLGEYRHVLLTQEQYDNLHLDYPNADELIKFFDEYIEEKPNYKSANHNLAIRKWVVKAVEENKMAKPIVGSSYRYNETPEQELARRTAAVEGAFRR